jgi:hypothetical protein
LSVSSDELYVVIVPESDEIRGRGGDTCDDSNGGGAGRATICFVGLGIDAEASAVSLSFLLSSSLSSSFPLPLLSVSAAPAFGSTSLVSTLTRSAVTTSKNNPLQVYRIPSSGINSPPPRSYIGFPNPLSFLLPILPRRLGFRIPSNGRLGLRGKWPLRPHTHGPYHPAHGSYFPALPGGSGAAASSFIILRE